MIIMLAMVDQNGAITSNGTQPYTLKHDMRVFSAATMNRYVVYGRKTLESFPRQRPLALRRNIILTHNVDLNVDESYGPVQIIHDIQELFELAKEEDIFVIGGESVYKQFADQNIAQFAIITRVLESFQNPDKYFPDVTDTSKWKNVMRSIVFDDTTSDNRTVKCQVEYYWNMQYDPSWHHVINAVFKYSIPLRLGMMWTAELQGTVIPPRSTLTAYEDYWKDGSDDQQGRTASMDR